MPHVRVEFAVVVVVMMAVFIVVMVMIVVMMMVVSASFERRNACAGLDKRHFALLHGTHDIGFFQAQTVQQNQFGGGDFAQIRAV